MVVTSGGCLIGRFDGEAGFQVCLGTDDDFIRKSHGVTAVAKLDSDEVGDLWRWLLASSD